MADTSKLWFEMGVRDEVASALAKDIKTAEKLQSYLTDIGNDKSFRNNFEEVSRALSEIDAVLKQIQNQHGTNGMRDAQRGLKKLRSEFKDLAGDVDKMATGGSASTLRFATGLDQALDKAKRVSNILATIRESLTSGNGGVDVEGLKFLQGNIYDVMGSRGSRNISLDMVSGWEERLQSLTSKELAYAASARQAAATNQLFMESFDKVAAAGKETDNIIGQIQIKLGTYFSLWGLQSLYRGIIEIGGAFEQQHIALQSILQDAQKGTAIFAQMKQLAVVSPFNFSQLAKYTKQTAAFGVPYEELYDTTKRLADLSAGLGVDMQRLILAYGQVRSAAVLRGQELRQFTEAGIPMVRALADEFTKLNGKVVTTGEVFGLIQKRQVPFEMVKKVLWDMTNEGGRFYDMQFVLSDTLLGKWSNLRDAWEILLSDFAKGTSISGRLLKGMITSVTWLLDNLQRVSPLLQGLIVSFGGLKVFRGIGSYLNLSVATINSTIQKTQKQLNLEIERRYLAGKINAEEYKRLMTMNEYTLKQKLLLAQEGRLSAYQVKRLLNEKEYSREQLKILTAKGAITAEDEKQVLLLQEKYRSATMFSGALGSIKNFFKTNALGIALTAAFSTLFALYQHYEEIKQKNKELFDGLSNSSRELSESLMSMRETKSTDYASEIEGLKELIKQHTDNYYAIIHEAEGIEDLQKRYVFLKETLSNIQKGYDIAMEHSESFANKTRSTFESIAKDIKKANSDPGGKNWGFWSNLFGGHEDMWTGETLSHEDQIKQYAQHIANVIREEYADVDIDETQKAAARESVRRMMQEAKFTAKDEQTFKIRLNDLVDLYDKEGILIDNVRRSFDNLIEQTAPELARKIRKGQYIEPAEEELLKKLVNNATNIAKKEYPQFANELQALLDSSDFVAKIRLSYEQADLTTLGKFVEQNINASGTQLSPEVNRIAELWVKDAKDDMFEARNIAKKDIDAAFNAQKSALDAQAKAAENLAKAEGERQKKSAEQAKKLADKLVKETSDDYSRRVAAAKYGLFFDYTGEDKKSNKKPKGSKKDTVLEAAKTQLDAIKKFYSEYKKYREVYGEERALSIVDALFPSVDGKAVVENYKKVIENLLANAVGKGADWEKYRNQLSTLLAEIDLDQTKEELSKALKAMERYIQDETSKWNLYKELKGKAGKDFAMLAFTDNVKWDDMTRGMAEQLRAAMEKTGTKGYGLEGFFEMDDEQAKKFFGANEDQLKLWQEIAKTIRKNWVDDLKEIGAATEKLKTTEEKIRDVENEIADLRRQGAGANDPRVIVKQNELKRLGVEAYENSEPYLKFYSSIFAMTAEEAEDAGAAIKENLVRQLADGVINADKYVKSIKNVDAQLQKIRDSRSDAFTLLTGGIGGLLQKRQNVADSEFNAAALRVQFAEKEMVAARKAAYSAATEEEKKAATQRYALAWIELENAKKTLAARQKELFAIVEITKANEDFLVTVDMIAGMIDGMAKAAQQISDMFDALGHEGSANTWSDIADGIGAVGSSISALSGMLKSGMSGDIGGVISNAVGIFTNPITAFAKLHDKKLDRKIQRSQKEVRRLTTEYQNLQKAIENTLGGIYSTGGYDEMFASLQKQRDELQKQYDAESDKKKKDSEKLADYEQQLKEANETINNFALDMAKSLYNIDLQGWAKDLTDAIVNAWENGEDAVEAYRSKVKDIMKDLTQNILAKKVMEKAFESLGIDEIIASMMDATSGKLNESAIPRLAEALNAAGEMSANVITRTLDNLEAKGYIEKGDGSSGSRNVIHGDFTEQETGLLLSYVNAIRGDVSLNRMTLSQILLAVQGQTEMPVIAQAQLQQLEQISANTMRNAEAAEAIQDILHKATLDKAYGFAVK